MSDSPSKTTDAETTDAETTGAETTTQTVYRGGIAVEIPIETQEDATDE
jgi:hypothetical protein